ncbi:Coatomer subunit delta [Chondrus crispus]|uniref:Coatomer subunit delta n=1 Tax=Chondrus crispus TaxID=2769 RepID=R7QMY2_CHOCR|nr:Coatomer subunit delta [Chondrus crispus]CDF38841.1 Coatomer subunit delta [Chondrus crispus]|eukprot:XP_005718746.1 Coatomer subunit delta [Chondrus crispus]
MVVLSAAVTTKAGKVVLSRQYRELSRIRIEGLLAAFPKLIGTDRQHTYVETDNVRYVYQPVETLYVLLITTKNSNIVEDLETLRLLGKILPEYSPRYGVVDEESVMEAAFEIIYSFDEVIDWGGLRENVDLQQIATFTEMYSHEERLVKMIQESKMAEAKEERKRREEEIRRQRSDGGDRLGMLGNELGKMLQAGGMGSFAQDLGLTGLQNKAAANAAYAAAGGISSDSYAQQQSTMGMGGGGGMGMSGMGSQMGMGMNMRNVISSSSGYGRSNAGPPPVAGTAAKKGMSLGKGKKQDNILDSLRAEGEVVDAPVSRLKGAKANAAAAAAYVPPSQAIHLATIEKLNLTVSRDGGIQNMEVKGDLMLRVTDSAKAGIRLQVSTGGAESNGVQFRTHPNVDRTLFSTQGLIGLKDPKRPFPTGNPLGVLRWRLVTKEEDKAPLLINCWPSDNGDESVVNIEYELGASKELRDVVITIPIGTSSQPTVNQCDGEFVYNSRTQSVEWRLAMIDESNSQGSLEFSTGPTDANAFFPINVSFSSKYTYAPIVVSQVALVSSGEPVEFGHDVSLVPDTFSIV